MSNFKNNYTKKLNLWCMRYKKLGPGSSVYDQIAGSVNGIQLFKISVPGRDTRSIRAEVDTLASMKLIEKFKVPGMGNVVSVRINNNTVTWVSILESLVQMKEMDLYSITRALKNDDVFNIFKIVLFRPVTLEEVEGFYPEPKLKKYNIKDALVNSGICNYCTDAVSQVPAIVLSERVKDGDFWLKFFEEVELLVIYLK